MKTQKEVKEEMAKAYKYGQYLINKAQDPKQKFLDHKPMCSLCLGTGSRIIYKYGIAYRQKCETATWDNTTKQLICVGNLNAQELELQNKKDLSSEIWKIVVKAELKEAFSSFLKQDYKTNKLSSLLTQELCTVLCMLRNGRLLRALSFYKTQELKIQQVAA